MFVLNRQSFRGADTFQLNAFVNCWERYYQGAVSISRGENQYIDYFAELNLEDELSEQSILRLLRWKDPRMLSTPLRNGSPNPRVTRVIQDLAKFNAFRRNELTPEDFGYTAASIFNSGIIWQLFLFHIARPWDWPIADQHVFRAYATLFNATVPKTLQEFESYKECFTNLAQLLPSPPGPERVAIIRRNKRLDNALMSFGQFLLKYDR